MFTRIVECSVRTEKQEELRNKLRSEVVPILQKQSGFVDEISLVSDRDPERMVAISFWPSAFEEIDFKSQFCQGRADGARLLLQGHQAFVVAPPGQSQSSDDQQNVEQTEQDFPISQPPMLPWRGAGQWDSSRRAHFIVPSMTKFSRRTGLLSNWRLGAVAVRRLSVTRADLRAGLAILARRQL